MTIWFAAAIPSSSYGGVQRVMQRLAQELMARGHTVSIITTGERSASYIRFAITLFRMWLAAPARPDWLVARSTDAVLVALALRLLGGTTRVALHNHGWEEKVYETEQALTLANINPATSWKARQFRFPLLRLTLRSCHLCLSGTLDEIRWLRGVYPAQRPKMRYLPTGVDMPTAPHWLTHPADSPSILFVGPDTWKKNLTGALDIFLCVQQRLPQARWHAAGCGSIDKTLHAKAGPESIWIEQVEPSAMLRWYCTCPFLISTSRYEGGHAMAILEAMAQGCIVFVSPIASSREIVIHGHNGFIIDPDNSTEAANLIEQVFTDPQLQATIRQAACRTAAHHRWSRWAQRLERVLA